MAAARLDFRVNPQRLLSLSLAALVGVAIALLLLRLLIRFESSDPLSWKIVTVSPLALPTLAIFVVVLTLVVPFAVSWLLLKGGLQLGSNHSKLHLLTICGGMFSLVLGLGLIAMSFDPSRGSGQSPITRLVPFIRGTDQPRPLVGYTLFFENGGFALSKAQNGALDIFFQSLKGCRGLVIQARGFVSSAPYGTDNEKRNLKLAKDRVVEVARIAARAGVHMTSSPDWPSLEALSKERAFADTAETRMPLTEREQFNRRVELLVSSYGDCADLNLAGLAR